jgi:hypothetical protein
MRWVAYAHPNGTAQSPKSSESKAQLQTWAEAEEHGLVLGKTWLDGLAELFELWECLYARRSHRFTH